jgi:hypothetical protein
MWMGIVVENTLNGENVGLVLMGKLALARRFFSAQPAERPKKTTKPDRLNIRCRRV